MSRTQTESKTGERRRQLLETLGFAEGAVAPELWSWVAFLVFVGFVAGLFYLGARPGGTGPLFAYTVGRDLLVLLALVVLLFGVLRSLLVKPFLQRKRGYAFLCLALVIGVAPVPLPYPSSHEGHPSPIHFRLPVEGEWRVFWGGSERAHNRLGGILPDQRWAMHLVKEVAGTRWRRSPAETPADSWSYGEPVLAPAAGRVERVRDGIPDGVLGSLDREVPAGGNLVVLEVAPGQFLFVTHLAAGSIPVTQGDEVEAGALLGRVGYSGASTFTPEPHVAIHLQDTPDEGWGEAIPWHFHDYLADGRPVERGLPRGGLDQEGRLSGERVAQAP